MKRLKKNLIILPFLCRLFFETRNRLNRCLRNQLPFCSLIILFQSKTRLSCLFKLKCSRNCCNVTYHDETERQLFVRVYEHLGITPMTPKRFKNFKKCAIMHHILLEGHNATYCNFHFSSRKQ